MEAEITGRLEHTGIVPVYSLGQDNEGHPCYAMRFIRGETLEDEIHRFHESGGGPSERSPGLRLLVKRLVSVGCDRASAKDFHEIRAVFTRGVA